MAYRDIVLAASPWAYWRGQVSAGQVLDETGNNRHMNVVGSSLTTGGGILPGDAAPCLVFPGLDTDYLYFRDPAGQFNMGVNSSVTMECWLLDDANDDNFNGTPFSFGRDGGTTNGARVLDINNVAKICPVTVNWPVSSIGPTVRTGKLTHIVMAYDSGAPAATAAKTYINAIEVSAMAMNLSSNAASNKDRALGILLGGTGATPVPVAGTALKAKMQEAAVYLGALTPSQITQHYYAGIDTGVVPKVLLATWIGNNQIHILFNKPMFQTGTTANFTVSGGATVSAATVSADFTSVTLTVAGVPANASRTVTLSANVKDALGAAPSTSTASFIAFADASVNGAPHVNTASIAINTHGGIGVVAVSPENKVDTGIRYNMRAFNTSNEEVVTWSATSPDFSAAQSGVDPNLLEDIVLMSVSGPTEA